MSSALLALSVVATTALSVVAPNANAAGSQAIDQTINLTCFLYDPLDPFKEEVVSNIALTARVKATVPATVNPGESAFINDAQADITMPPATVRIPFVTFNGADTLSGEAVEFNILASNTLQGGVNVANPPIPFGPIALVRSAAPPYVYQPANFTVPVVPLQNVGPVTASGAAGTNVVSTFGGIDTLVKFTKSTTPGQENNLALSCPPPSPAPLLATIPIVAAPEPPPVIASIAPTSGPSAGGTSVVITGTNLTGVNDVDFGTTNATSFTVNSATQITAIAPAGTPASVVDVRATHPTRGTSANTPLDDYTYIAPPPPAVTSLAPNKGPTTGGTSVVITGTGFTGTTGAASVKFGANNATSYVVNSATQITAVAPAGAAGVVSVAVTSPNGSSSTAGTGDDYTYETPAPTVTTVSPTSGTTAGGTSVTITGTNFVGVSGAAAVKFGANNAASYTVNSATSITATSPAGAAGTVDVTVTTPTGTSPTTGTGNDFAYVAPPVPTVTGLSPATGLTTGGTSVVITGTNLTGATGAAAVKFGANNATSYTVNSATQITAVAPAGAAGTVDVTVTTPNGTSSTAGTGNDYTYNVPPPAPTVTGLSPATGFTTGGTSVVITGTGFTGVSGASAVKFGANNATSYTVNSATQITAVAPAGAAGTVDVTVTNANGTSPATGTGNDYTYTVQPPAPTVTGLSPATGLTAGGTSVVITGTGFTGATGAAAVKFGANNATSYTVNSSTQITAVAPAGAAGTVNVTVTTPDGTSSTAGTGNDYTYNVPPPAPTVTGLAPATGFTTGGTSVVITGTGFTGVSGASAVQFGANNATSYTVNSATQITAVAPAGAAGTVNVTVTNANGTSPTTGTGNDFLYTTPPPPPAPTVTNLAPATGLISGGTTVTITGTGFTGATGAAAVKFGANNAASYTVNSATSITAVSPAGAAGTVNVTVTTPDGTSSTTGTGNDFLYTTPPPPPPTCVSIAPASGPGGTSVVITGTNLTGASVKFGAATATAVVNSSTQITAVAPAGAPGAVSVTVTTAQGTATCGSFTYPVIPKPPTISSTTPASGPVAGGTSVTINGTNLDTVTSVKFGAADAASFTKTATQIVAVSPAGVAGAVALTVTNPDGTATGSFTYTTVPLPTITSISPTSGTETGGTSVVIRGTNLGGVTSVKFGDTPATSFTKNSSTQITARSPAGVIGTVDISVSAGTVSSANTAADNFTYTAAPVGRPTVTKLFPNTGLRYVGGITVITGTGFKDVKSVKFGSTSALVLQISSTTIIAIAPSKPAGLYGVTVTTPKGTSLVTSASKYRYL